ncbi:hypothetical protein KAI87_13085, partial [Myxococcota bacterium]|nr:hypothetical protein [Myxococcota bacterium]
MLNTKPRIITQNERGMALIFVVVMLTAAFIGGMAAVGLTNGYLSRSRGFRTQAAVQACAEAGMAQMHSLLPDIADFAATDGQINIGGPTLSYRAGHYNKDGPSPFEVLDPQEYDAASL